MFSNKRWSRKFAAAGSVLVLVMAFFLTGCSGSGSGGGNANSVTIEPIAGSLIQQKIAGIDYYSIQKDFNIWNDTSHDITLSDSVTNQQYQQYYGQYISTGNENYLKMLVSKSVTAKAGNKIYSCIVITEKGEQTKILSGQSVKMTVVTYGPTDESTLEIYYKGGFQTKIQYGEGAEDSDTDYTPTGHLGDTIQLMGEHTLYNTQSEPTRLIQKADGTVTLSCSMGFKNTTKNSLCIASDYFQVVVSRSGISKESYDVTKKELELSPETPHLTSDAGEFKATLTVADIQVEEGDTIEVKYWPLMQASSSQAGFTRVYCTWTMTVYRKNDGTLDVK